MEQLSQASLLSGQAQQERQQGRVDAALALWAEAIALDPRNPDHVIALTNCLAQIGRSQEALQFCERWLEQNSDIALLWMQKGIIQINQLSDTQGVIDSFHAALRCDPAYTLAHEALAQIYLVRLQAEPVRFHAAQAATNADPRSAFNRATCPTTLVQWRPGAGCSPAIRQMSKPCS